MPLTIRNDPISTLRDFSCRGTQTRGNDGEQPVEAVKNNVGGSMTLADMANELRSQIS